MQLKANGCALPTCLETSKTDHCHTHCTYCDYLPLTGTPPGYVVSVNHCENLFCTHLLPILHTNMCVCLLHFQCYSALVFDHQSKCCVGKLTKGGQCLERCFAIKMRNWKQTLRRGRICVSISSSLQQGQKAGCLFPVHWLHSIRGSEAQAWTMQMNCGWDLTKGPLQGEQGRLARKEGADASISYHLLHVLELQNSLLSGKYQSANSHTSPPPLLPPPAPRATKVCSRLCPPCASKVSSLCGDTQA